MEDEKCLRQARSVFETLCKALDDLQLSYDKDEEELCVDCKITGEDFPVDLDIMVNTDSMLIILLSHLPFTAKEEKRLELAVAVSVVNNKLGVGNFDYNIKTGRMVFRMTNSFMDSLISKEALSTLIVVSYKVVDKYNDQFVMLIKDFMSLDQFIAEVNK